MIFKRSLPILLGLALLGVQGCIHIPPFGPSNDRGTLRLEMLDRADRFFTNDQILMIPLTGLVSTGSLQTGMGGEPGMLVALRDRLDAAKENPNICAVVLRIDSPGGTVTASDLIHREILQFKEETKLPVIAQLTGVAASGGVYIAMAADEIYALPTTITGSIGVIGMYLNMEGLSQKIGIGMNVIKSGAMKDAGSPWRSMTAEERKVMQALVDNYYARFMDIILTSRRTAGMTRKMLTPLADGRVLTPDQALEIHLIDGIGYLDEVFARAKELAKLSDADLVSYEYPYHVRGNILAQGPDNAPTAKTGDINLFNLDLGNLANELAGAHFCYLWLP